MEKISVYFISIILFIFSFRAIAQDESPDTLDIPLKLKIGLEVAGPVIYFTEKNILSTECYLSADLNEKMALFLGAGYSDYKYSQYNYDYLNKGFFLKAGVDFNILKPQIAMGKYWAGIGLHYGLSSFKSETPFLKFENYWGTTTSSVPPGTHWGHYLEASPGFRAEIFRNFSIGWSLSLRKLIFAGTNKDLKPIYIPGYGTADRSFSTGISYYLMWNITYKRIRVTVKPEAPSETVEQEESGVTDTGVKAPFRAR